MSRKRKARSLARHVAAAAVAGILAVASAQTASSYSSGEGRTIASEKENCLFSLQLQKSVAARRQYLVALNEVTRSYEPGAVDEMYGNIQQAAYEEQGGRGRESIFSYLSRGAEQPGAALDSFSADCLGCHDGANASAIGVDLRNSPIRKRSRVNSFKSDHPIGMEYNMYVAGSRGFKPVLPGSNRMVFVDGKVGCLTCHDPLNPEKGHLVMSDRESALCRTCHDK